MNKSADLKNPAKWNAVNSRVLKLYPDHFTRRQLNVLTEMKFASFRKQTTINSPKRFSPSSSRSSALHDLVKNHAALKSETKIVKLPMSPFGKHSNYNNEENFTRAHFLNSASAESKEIEKKIKSLKKKIVLKKKSKIVTRGYLNALQDMDAYKTKGGVLYCKAYRKSVVVDEEKTDFMSTPLIRKSIQLLTPTRLIHNPLRRNFTPISS